MPLTKYYGNKTRHLTHFHAYMGIQINATVTPIEANHFGPCSHIISVNCLCRRGTPNQKSTKAKHIGIINTEPTQVANKNQVKCLI